MSSKIEQEWQSYNKQMRKQHLHFAQFDTIEEYVQYKKGKYKSNKDTFIDYKPAEKFRRATKEYKSYSGKAVEDTSKPEKKLYTGTLVKGISVMHKSNAVPIINAEQAKEHANMRR